MTTPPDWGALFQQHHAAMRRAAAHILYPKGRQDLADDAVMQAILTLIAHPPPNIGNAEALLVATAKHKAIDIIRSFEIAHRAARPLNDDDLQSEDVEPAAIDHLDHGRVVRQIMAEIDKLPDLQQQIIRKTIMQEHTTRQVAIELGLSPARISQMRAMALMTLRSNLARISNNNVPGDFNQI